MLPLYMHRSQAEHSEVPCFCHTTSNTRNFYTDAHCLTVNKQASQGRPGPPLSILCWQIFVRIEDGIGVKQRFECGHDLQRCVGL